MSGWALVVVAAFWAVLVGFLSFALVSLFRTLQATRDLVEDFRRQATPMLRELTETVESVNREMKQVDEILASARGTASAVEGITKALHAAVTHPVIRALAVAAGAARAYQRFRKGRER